MVKIHSHRIRYWLHSSEKVDSPESFAEKVNEICSVYHEAETNAEAGGHTISVDEMTGIQALEHKYPDKPAKDRISGCVVGWSHPFPTDCEREPNWGLGAAPIFSSIL